MIHRILACWLGSDVLRKPEPHIVHTSCIGVFVSSHHYQTNNSHRHINFHPQKAESSGSTNIQVHTDSFLREDPFGGISSHARRSHIKKVINCRRVPRATAKILHVDHTLDFFVNPLSSCTDFHIYPRVAVPSGTASSFAIHFLLRHTTPPPHSWYLYVFQNATKTNESIFNCHCNCYPYGSREERYASQVINIKAKSARPILLHHA